MRIKQIVNQNRRDFLAIYICEHCNFEAKGEGYDDSYFHQKVIPDMICKQCGKKADHNYRPLTTKYNDGELV